MRLLIGFSLVCASLVANAHPVSFKKGIGFMSYNSEQMNELLLTYSFNSRFAVATTYINDSDSQFYIPRANFLLKRWNEDDSQANIYLSGGTGIEAYEGGTHPAQLVEFIADWESRKYYTYFEHLYLNRDNEDNPLIPEKSYNHTKARLGFAPFLADYNDLNVWFITQFDRHKNEDQVDMTQFLRFYMKNVLWEVGAGFHGNFAFNFMVHI